MFDPLACICNNKYLDLILPDSETAILFCLLVIYPIFVQIFSPFFYKNLQLLNLHGMGKIKMENYLLEKKYPNLHWYIKANYDGVEKPFYSVFTRTYSEITQFLNERYEQSPDNIVFKLYRALVYHVPGSGLINILALY